MASQVINSLVDDLDGSEATDTVAFGLDGVKYTIDLNAANAETLHKTLEPYVSVARVVPAKGRKAK